MSEMRPYSRRELAQALGRPGDKLTTADLNDYSGRRDHERTAA